MKFTVEKKIFLTLALFAGGILLVVGLVIVPTIRMITKVSAESAETRLSLQTEQTDFTNFRELLQKIKTLTTRTADYSERLFKTGDALLLITALEKTADDNRVNQKIDSSNFDAITNQKATVALTVNGSYADVIAYLAAVERLPHFITLEQITLSPGE